LEYGEAFLDNILTMGESNVPLLTPQPKMTTSQGLTKSIFCLSKFKRLESRTNWWLCPFLVKVLKLNFAGDLCDVGTLC